MIEKKHWGISLLALLALLAACGPKPNPEPRPDSKLRAEARDETAFAGLPAIGKWMIAPDSAPAHWLNEIYHGRHLREPINIIIIDNIAKSPTDARDRLLRALKTAGFPPRLGHSNGYRAMIGGTEQGQLTDSTSGTFSNEPFEFNNDHGRIFGPLAYRGAYVWTGTFSREKIAPFAEVKHEYVSFNNARDAFSVCMDERTAYHREGFVPLENTLLFDSARTTGDHDGIAILLLAKE